MMRYTSTLSRLSLMLSFALAACSRQAIGTLLSEIATAARPTGELREDVLLSSALGVRKHLVVYLPPSYAKDTTRRFPVVYYLHGLYGSETDWVSKGSLDVTADSLFDRGTPEMILVMPDGDDGWYTTWDRQVPFRTCADTVSSAPPFKCVVTLGKRSATGPVALT